MGYIPRDDVQFITGYNPSHLAGAGDLIESLSQLFGSPINEHDFKTILLQIHPEVVTRKILLVGHSQGTFYANEMYSYLLAHGEPREAVGIYNLATPASFVAGDGRYLTSRHDKVINAVREAAERIGAKQPLPANIDIPLSREDMADRFGGHSFSNVYLANAAGRIIPEIENALNKLIVSENSSAVDTDSTSSPQGGCFISPEKTVLYYAEGAGFLVADSTANGAVAAGKGVAAAGELAYNGSVTLAKSAVAGTKIIYANVSNAVSTAYAGIGSLFAGGSSGGQADSAHQGIAVISNSFGNSNQPNNDTVIPDSNSENESPIIPQDSLASEANIFSSYTTTSENADSQTSAPNQQKNTTSAVALSNSSSNATTALADAFRDNQLQVFSGGGGGGLSGGGGVSAVQDSSVPASGTSTPAISSSTATSSTALSPVNHIVISEVLFDAAGSDVGKEFVELYNPNGSGFDLTGWSLKHQKENSTATVSLASFKTASHPEDITLIPSKGFLLIGLNNYDATNYSDKSADIKRTVALPNGQAAGGQPEKIFLILNDASSTEVDRVIYDKNSISSEGQSLERKVIQSGACVSSQHDGEFLGNDCDTNADSDFETRSSPNPQNSASLPEPRDAPAANNLQITYDFAPRFDFSWDLSSDSAGATSTLSYSIYDASAPSSTLVFEAVPATSTIATSTTYSVNEIGRNYDFEFKVQDRDGLSSVTTSTIVAKSFLDKFYFYRDTRPSSTAYFFDLTTTSSRPFWNANDPTATQGWKGIVFYLNKDAPKQSTISTADALIPIDPNFVRLSYSGCGGGGITIAPELIFPLNGYSCQPGPLSAYAYLIGNLEDQRFAVSLTSSTSDISFSSSDYATLAFYDFGGGGGGSQRLQLAAVDTTKYHFQNSPAVQAAPTTPGNFSANFDTASGRLNLSWSVSTDADTLDSLIRYEVNYSTSTVFEDPTWNSTSNLLYASTIPVFPNNYKIGVRATDDFDNVSPAATLDWSFPAGFVLVPSQLNHDAAIGTTGAGQKIFISNSAIINGAALWTGPDSGWYNNSQSYLELHRDNNNSIGELLATSTAKTFNQHDDSQEVVYILSSPISLEASSSYWLVPAQVPSVNTNGTRIYGTVSDSYPDGFWSAHPGYDAYFRLTQQ